MQTIPQFKPPQIGATKHSQMDGSWLAFNHILQVLDVKFSKASHGSSKFPAGLQQEAYHSPLHDWVLPAAMLSLEGRPIKKNGGFMVSDFPLNQSIDSWGLCELRGILRAVFQKN